VRAPISVECFVQSDNKVSESSDGASSLRSILKIRKANLALEPAVKLSAANVAVTSFEDIVLQDTLHIRRL
jgi:hypothetical protein